MIWPMVRSSPAERRPRAQESSALWAARICSAAPRTCRIATPSVSGKHRDSLIGTVAFGTARAASTSMRTTSRRAALAARLAVRPGSRGAISPSKTTESSTDRQTDWLTTACATGCGITPSVNSWATCGRRWSPRARPTWVPAAEGPMLRAMAISPMTDSVGSPRPIPMSSVRSSWRAAIWATMLGLGQHD